MTEQILLRTKLFAPPPRRNLLARHRLLDRLDGALFPEIRLTLVSAPAGFGKTTLMSAWLRKPEIGQFAWLTLDKEDNDPVRFWRYLDAALQGIDPRLGESIRPSLFAPQPAPFRGIVTGLVNDILAVGVPFVLVLDDYHQIESDAVHEALNYLVDHLPSTVKLIILTRSDPPLQLARRRGRGELCEIRAAELRFNRAEVNELINEILRLDLSHEDIAALEYRTEGWIAGLQMAAFSLQDVADPHEFVTAFQGDDRYIADYLLEEVLQRQPVEFQTFLLETSILDRLNGSLCDAITGRLDSGVVLNTLERANLFLIPLDNRREWFRYHHLFANLLSRRLLETRGEPPVHGLKQRAAGWYAAHGFIVKAVELYLDSADFEQAVELIEKSDLLLFLGSEINTLARWAALLPAEVISARPRLLLMAAWAAHATAKSQLCERFIHMAEQSVGLNIEDLLAQPPGRFDLEPVKCSMLLEAAVIRTSLAVNHLDLLSAFELGERLRPHLAAVQESQPFAFNPPGNLRAPHEFSLGMVHLLSDDLDRAVQSLTLAAQEGQRVFNFHILAVALGHLGEVQLLQGHPDQARATWEQALQHAAANPSVSIAFWGLAHNGLGSLAYERNDLASAGVYFKAGLELGKTLNAWECLLPGYLGIAQIHFQSGRAPLAVAALHELLELTGPNEPAVRPAVEAALMLFKVAQNDLQAVEHWLAKFDPHTPAAYRQQWNRDALLAVRIWTAQARYVQAEELLDFLLVDARAGGRVRQELEILILRSLLLQAQGRIDPARAVLLQALSLAEPQGYLRLFLDHGERLQKLLHGMAAQDTRIQKYLYRLLEGFARTDEIAQPQSDPANQTGLVEPLSERELEVLRLIARGLSNPEIAAQLYLSPNTLKSHSQNIYAKLDVHSRMEAANKARELGLI